MTTLPDQITGGVDTHLDIHVAAALDPVGGLLGVESFPADAGGYRRLLDWLQSFGTVTLVGGGGHRQLRGGAHPHLHQRGVGVVEVDRPNRQERRRAGKSDPLDAIEAARAALSGRAKGTAKTRNGNVEAIRVLRVARSSARKDRVRALNQIRSLISTAPEELRRELRGLSIFRLVNKAIALRPNGRTDVVNATKLALRSLARRVRDIDAEIAEIDAVLDPLVADTAPDLLTRPGIGPDTAGALLVAAGDNPDRLRNECSFAHLCGASPLDASSGKQLRHRLNRGGDRMANAALWRIVLVRMASDPRTQRYVERRCKEGLTKPEAMRCLKRYVARKSSTTSPDKWLDTTRSIIMGRCRENLYPTSQLSESTTSLLSRWPSQTSFWRRTCLRSQHCWPVAVKPAARTCALWTLRSLSNQAPMRTHSVSLSCCSTALRRESGLDGAKEFLLLRHR